MSLLKNLPLRFACALVLPFSLMLSSCATKKAPPPSPQKQAFKMYEWNNETLSKTKGAVSIAIYLDQQKAYFYKGGQQVGWTYVATGRPGHETPSGSFRIIEKTVDKISNLY